MFFSWLGRPPSHHHCFYSVPRTGLGGRNISGEQKRSHARLPELTVWRRRHNEGVKRGSYSTVGCAVSAVKNRAGDLNRSLNGVIQGKKFLAEGEAGAKALGQELVLFKQPGGQESEEKQVDCDPKGS